MVNIAKEGEYCTVVDGGMDCDLSVRNPIKSQMYSPFNQYRWERILYSLQCNLRGE